MAKPNWVYFRAQPWRFYRSRGSWHWSLRLLVWLALVIVIAITRKLLG